MKTLYVVNKNHLDLTWRRCFERCFDHDGYQIRPYAEIEELLLDWWIDALQKGDMVYDLEETMVLRKYLERNPDQLETLRTLIQSGRLNLLGGGESVIDYNLVDGESMVRNHFYSRRYLEDTFGVTPRFANCPDTFGLSAQMPQLFRQLGYPALSEFHRVFLDHKPVWQGISGDQIALSSRLSADIGSSDFVKYPACAACHGEGCEVCGGTGLDVHYRHFDFERDRDQLIRQFERAAELGRDAVMAIGSEEVLEPDNYEAMVNELAARYGFEVRFIGTEDMVAMQHPELIQAVAQGDVDPSLVDERREGNPTGSGCYVSRIRVKQENRRIEAYLRAAETLATLAGNYGFPYPRKTLERLWNRLSVYQFHDAIPASHSDAAYQELLDMAREIKSSCMRIVRQATSRILERVDIASGEGIPFVVFNPLAWDVDHAPLTGVVRVPRHSGTLSGQVVDSQGQVHPIERMERVEGYAATAWKLSFSASLPAFGYEVFRFVAQPAGELPAPAAGCLENEFFRIQLCDTGIASIYDKRLGRQVMGEGACAPCLEEDAGQLWGRMGLRGYEERADDPFSVDFMTPSKKHRVEVCTEAFPGGQRARVRVTYDRPEERLHDLEWIMTVSLRDGCDRVEFSVDTRWDSEDLRLMARFPLPFATPKDQAVYEIPLGQLERVYTQAFDAQLGHSDDHAALRYWCAHDSEQDWTLALFNTGTPAHRLKDGVLYVSLLRSPTRLLCGYDIDGVRSTDWHHFEFALGAWAGGPQAGNPAQVGWTYNALFPSFPVHAQQGTLPERGQLHPAIPDGVMLSCLKRAEDESGTVYRVYEPYGLPAQLPLAAREIDLLERHLNEGELKQSFSLRPFELKTLYRPDAK